MSSTALPFANTPEPPYYAVIFSSQRTPDDNGYHAMAEKMVQLASQQPGYLGIESTRNAEGFGITVSYWTSLEAIGAWQRHGEHLEAQRLGKQAWYQYYKVRVAKVERIAEMGEREK